MKNANQKINVLHLIEHLKVAGAEKVVVSHIQTLSAQRFNSAICLYREVGHLDTILQKAGFPIVFLRKDVLSNHFHGFFRILRPPFLLIDSILFVVRLAGLIRKRKIHIVHSHMFSANLWGRLAVLMARNTGIISTEHTRSGWHHPVKHALINRLLSPLSDKVVAVSREVANTIIKEQKLRPEQITVIPNGVKFYDLKDSKETDIFLKERNIPVTPPIIANVGRLVKVKRQDILLKVVEICAEQVPKLSCWIIGDGAEKLRLEQLAQDLNITDRVFFLGERNDVRTLLRKVDIVVNTSDHEGLPVSLLEAMAEAVPVVATDVGGSGELVKTNETGILVKAGDIEGIAKGICKMLMNPVWAKSLAANGQKKIRDSYSIENITKMWEVLYTDIAANKGISLN